MEEVKSEENSVINKNSNTNVFRNEGTPCDHLFFGLNEESFEEGSYVEGIIVLVVQQEKLHVSKIGIHWHGKEFTNWYEGLKQDKQCSSERIIFDTETQIWIPSEDSTVAPDGYFKKGTYTFPFSWNLPSAIPGSFVDEEGNLPGLLPSSWALPKGGVLPKSLFGEKSYISYFGTAFLESGHHGNKLQSSCVLKVLQKYDPHLLNLKPIEKHGEKTNLINFKNSMPLKMNVILPNGGIGVAGYKFPIHVTVVNGTSYVIRCIKISFRQNIVLSAPGSTFQRQKIVFEGEVPNSTIDKQGHYVKDLLIDVPSSIPQSIFLGTLIQRTYEVIVELVVSLSTNLSISADVKIFELPRLKPSVLPPGVVLFKSQSQAYLQQVKLSQQSTKEGEPLNSTKPENQEKGDNQTTEDQNQDPNQPPEEN